MYPMYCTIHAEDYYDECAACIDDEKALRPMKLFILASGYVAVVLHSKDVVYWGGVVIPLAYDSKTPCNIVVDRIRQGNPENLVTFAGGYHEYKRYLGLHIDVDA